MRRRTSVVSVLLVACLAVTGCGVSMPDSGTVHVTNATGSDRGDGSVSIRPRSPVKGATPEEVVRGFLDAMTETPAITTTVARQFLTTDAAVDWQPSGLVVYGAAETAKGYKQVLVELLDADRTDTRGAWLGPVPEDQTTVGFPMALQDGEWRIAQPPPFLMVPQSWFEQRFQQASLYFFDPTSTTLVPEPVLVPTGQQFASSLVNGLLQGPSADLAGTEQNYVPPGLRSLVSVPVTTNGLARVELTSDSDAAAVLSPEQSELLVSQLAWTFEQDPRIKHFQVTIDGRPVQLPGESEFSVQHGHGYAPFVAGSSTQLFGLQDGLMVGGSSQNLAAVTGPFGQTDDGLRTIAPDLKAENVAGVSSAGDTLSVAPVKDNGDQPRAMIENGQDLLRPAWDFSGRLWDVDRQATGAVVYYQRNNKMLPLDVRGVSGQDVKNFLVSRDGTRLIAVIRDPGGNDSIVVSRILSSSDGQVLYATRAEDITTTTDLQGQVRDIAWRSPTTLAVLRPVARQLFEVRTVSVDGAHAFDTTPITIDGDVLGLAGTPVPGSDIYAFVVARDENTDVVTSAALSNLDGPRDNMLQIDPRITMLGYVG